MSAVLTTGVRVRCVPNNLMKIMYPMMMETGKGAGQKGRTTRTMREMRETEKGAGQKGHQRSSNG